MIAVIIVTHERIGEAYRALAAHFLPDLPKHIQVLGVEPDEDHERIIQRIQCAVQDWENSSGVLVLSDLFGATPCNAAKKMLQPQRLAMLTGLNAPMMVKAIQYSATANDLMAFAQLLKKAAEDGIVLMTADEKE